MDPDAKYWFRAKRYGWGWGLPVRWEGWLVIAGFVGLLVLGSFLFPPRTEIALYLIYVVLLSVLLGAICWLKGEPTRWRWGE
ncbi:MAG TPA: hypothetical protein VKW08_15190 [Xanthobacteraceae bacterium]|jgi:hypothetical protein|nr:hypothetical protein [Xanthobacteraceae bacterium]